MRWRPGIRWWLIGANGFVLLAPLFGIGVLRIYDVYLLRQTERQLIAQAVLVAESWREAWLLERGEEMTGEDSFRPPDRASQRFVPYEPLIDIGTELQEPEPNQETFPAAPPGDTAARRAGKRIEPLLARAKVFNLSAVRVLDAHGCVVATTGVPADLCLGSLPEIERALHGAYASVARIRISDEPAPPLADIRRRGNVRVFAALPIFHRGEVVGVVRVSRTGLSALKSLWLNRRGLLILLVATVILTFAVSLLFARAIASPVRAITRNAEAIVRGSPPAPFTARRWGPAELQTLAGSLDRMTHKLAERAAYTAECAANVSHELKTPLTAIRGAAELLQDQWGEMEAEQRERFITNIGADVVRMERLVNRLLSLARIENAPVEERQVVEVRQFFAELENRYAPRVEIVSQEPPATISVHPDHLVSAVCNLIDNASSHGGDGPVKVRVASRGARLLVEVSDQGPGISAANQPKLFSRFFTTERDQGGTGLGLAIVKAVAEGRGGEVDFTTGPEGTTFRLVL